MIDHRASSLASRALRSYFSGKPFFNLSNMQQTAAYALAIQGLDGVGRATAGKILTAFNSYDDLLRYPREQILARIKGTPNAEKLVETLINRPVMEALFVQAEKEIRTMAERQIGLISAFDPQWPRGLRELASAQRPIILYAFGNSDLLSQPAVSLFAKPPLSGAAFESAQELTKHLLKSGIRIAAGVSTGFDLAIHRICFDGQHPLPSIMVANSGIGHVPASSRPTISLAVKAGGLLVSSFEPSHAFFGHNDRERTFVQAALGKATVFIEPRPETYEWQAMEWALEAQRPVFGLTSDGIDVPEQVHPIRELIDFEWVKAAALEI